MKRLFLLALVMSVMPLTALAEKAELKLLVTDKVKLEAAVKQTLASGDPTETAQVCFFDTDKAELNGKGLILRARTVKQDATVKLRNKDGGPVLDLAALQAQFKDKGSKLEADWTAVDKHPQSLSLDSEGLADEAIKTAQKDGGNALKNLLSEDQRKLAEAAVKPLDWDKLKPYGPIAAQIWKKQKKIAGEKSTIELWTLKREGKADKVMLEISIKVDVVNDAQVEQAAKDFYAACEADYGKPNGKSKTQEVFDYYLLP